MIVEIRESTPNVTVTEVDQNITVSVTEYSVEVFTRGTQGPTGETGAQGIQGIQGTAATIAAGTVTAGVTYSVSNSGSSSAATFNFVIPASFGFDGGQPVNTFSVHDGYDGGSP